MTPFMPAKEIGDKVPVSAASIADTPVSLQTSHKYRLRVHKVGASAFAHGSTSLALSVNVFPGTI